MSEELRRELLSVLRDHDRSGSTADKEDVALAEELGQELDDIRTQLSLLEARGLVSLFKTFDGMGAVIEPQGLDYLEQVEDQAKPQKPKGPLGFGRPRDE